MERNPEKRADPLFIPSKPGKDVDMIRVSFFLSLLVILFASCTVTRISITQLLMAYTASAPTPAVGATGVPRDVTLSWEVSQLEGILVAFDLLLGTSDQNLQPAVTGVEVNFTEISNLEYATRYFWQVVSHVALPQGERTSRQDILGPTWFFTTEPTPNLDPAVPSDPSPADGATHCPTSLSLEWQATDPDGDALVFDVYFGTVACCLDLVAEHQTAKSLQRSGLSYGNTYYWQVVAFDLSPGGKRAQKAGPVWSFSVEASPNRAPDAAHSPVPADGQTDCASELTLHWQCQDPDGDTLHFDVLFGNQPANLQPVAQDISTFSWEVMGLAYATNYYWKILASDGRGGNSESQRWIFTTRATPNTPPGPPQNPSPDDGATYVYADIELSWESLDPDSDSLRYDVYLGKDPNAMNRVGQDLDQPSLSLTGLDFNTPFYWQVQANDLRNGTRAITPSQTWSFTTMPTPNWSNCYGGSGDDSPFCLLPLEDGGYLMVGGTDSDDGDVQNKGDTVEDLWVIRTDENGLLLHEQHHHYAAASDTLFNGGSVAIENEEGFLVAGSCALESSSPSDGEPGLYLLQLDPYLNADWQQVLSLDGLWVFVASVLQLDSGDIILSGTASSKVESVTITSDFFVAKYDPVGETTEVATYGGSGDDMANSACLLSNGHLLLGGTSDSTDTDVTDHCGEQGYTDIWLAEVDLSDLSLVTAKSISVRSEPEDDELLAKIKPHPDGGFMVVGYIVGNDVMGGFFDALVVRLDEDYEVSWFSKFGSSGLEALDDFVLLDNGNTLCSGVVMGSLVYGEHGMSDAWVVEIDPHGTPLWYQAHGGSSFDAMNMVGTLAMLRGAYPTRTLHVTPWGAYVLGYATDSDDFDASGNHGFEDFWMIQRYSPEKVFIPASGGR